MQEIGLDAFEEALRAGRTAVKINVHLEGIKAEITASRWRAFGISALPSAMPVCGVAGFFGSRYRCCRVLLSRFASGYAAVVPMIS
ncbi:MAG: hypothetical protein NTV46_06155 [Verrucomicrobia bacterium]|nr:hypothetical protein [Verrucomicrobiota bacterium]